MRKKIIICEAIPFGYGPAAILYSLLQELHDDSEILIASSGSTYEFFRKTDYKTEFVDSYNLQEIESFLRHNSNLIKLVLSVENERFLYAAKQIGLKTVYVDLFEFIWDTSLLYMKYADKYIVYSLFEDERTRRKLKDRGAFFVAPRIPILKQRNVKNYCLIHIGGLNSKHIQADYLMDYARYVSLFIKEIQRIYGLNLKVVTCESFSEFLRRTLIETKEIEIINDISYDDFKVLLAECHVFFTTPGINSVLLGTINTKYQYFLFPANYTQCIQLKGFCKLLNLDLTYRFKLSNLRKNINEKKGLDIVHQKILLFNSDNMPAHVKDVISCNVSLNGRNNLCREDFDNFQSIIQDC